MEFRARKRTQIYRRGIGKSGYIEIKGQFMIVRIRFGRGRQLTHRKGKNRQAARLLASALSLVAISVAVLGFWALGQDLGIAGDFVFPTGLLSHWQVWLGAGAAIQYACWRLRRYSRQSYQENNETADAEAPVEKIRARV
jgi:hypothetical protein